MLYEVITMWKENAVVELYDLNGSLCQIESRQGQLIDIPIHLKPGIYLMTTRTDSDINLRCKFVVY